MAVKVMNEKGSGYNSWVASGIRYAADHGAEVISLSLGAPKGNKALGDACKYAYEKKGVVVVAATGNEYKNVISYPAKYDSVIAVTALKKGDKVTSFSNKGKEAELCAPGHNIYSCVPGGGYESWNGTSMACPHVSGVAGLVISQNSMLTASQVRSILGDTSVDLGVKGRDTQYGYGKVDACAAVKKAKPTGK
jgi:subtilisin